LSIRLISLTSLTDELKLQFSFCSKRIFMTIMTNIKIHFNINIAFDPLEIVSLFRQFSIINFQHAMIDSLEMIFLEWIFNTSRSFFMINNIIWDFKEISIFHLLISFWKGWKIIKLWQILKLCRIELNNFQWFDDNFLGSISCWFAFIGIINVNMISKRHRRDLPNVFECPFSVCDLMSKLSIVFSTPQNIHSFNASKHF
jgi:hypothetical protein